MANRLITIKVPEPRLAHQRFNVGPITFTGAAVALIKGYGPGFWSLALDLHIRGRCACGRESCDIELAARIASGQPVLTVHGPTVEPETSIIILTNAERTRTIVCSGLENCAEILTAAEALQPERRA